MDVITELSCNSCGETKPVAEFHKDRSNPTGYRYSCKECYLNRYRRGKGNKARQAKYQREYRRKSKMPLFWRRTKRLVAIEKLGGECECCGENRIEFLAIDHIDGRGNNKDRTARSGEGLINRVCREDYPRDRYRVLCHNCNSALGFYGYCPHQEPDVDWLTRERVNK